MSHPLRIAYLCPYSPWPPRFGGALRIDALWEALKTLGEVHLAVVGDRPARPVRLRLRAAGARIHPSRFETPLRRQVRLFRALLTDRCIPAARYVSRRRLQRIGAWLRTLDPDLVVLGDEYLASLLPHLPVDAERVVVDTHNAASRGHLRVALSGGGLVSRLQYLCLAWNTARVERRFFPQAGHVWAVSRDDAAYYERTTGCRVEVVPNVVEVPSAPPPMGDPRTVALTGSYSYVASEDAALRLLRIAAPLLADGTVARLLVVGSQPTARMRAIAAGVGGAELTGAVEDVAPYLDASGVFAAPIAAGSGTKFKILQAMARGRAVLTTPIGAEGIELTPGVHAEVVDLREFEASLRALCLDPVRQARLGAAGHALVRERYSREAMVGMVRRLLDR